MDYEILQTILKRGFFIQRDFNNNSWVIMKDYKYYVLTLECASIYDLVKSIEIALKKFNTDEFAARIYNSIEGVNLAEALDLAHRIFADTVDLQDDLLKLEIYQESQDEVADDTGSESQEKAE